MAITGAARSNLHTELFEGSSVVFDLDAHLVHRLEGDTARIFGAATGVDVDALARRAHGLGGVRGEAADAAASLLRLLG